MKSKEKNEKAGNTAQPAVHRSGPQSGSQCTLTKGLQLALVVKNPPASAGDIRHMGLIPGSGRFPGGGHGNPLQYSCLQNLVNRD